MPTSTQKSFAHIVVAAIAIPTGLLVAYMSQGKTELVDREAFLGLFTFAIGLLVFACSRYEWYWDILFTGYYRGWNNPAGRAFNTTVCIACMVMGLAMFAGLFPMR